MQCRLQQGENWLCHHAWSGYLGRYKAQNGAASGLKMQMSRYDIICKVHAGLRKPSAVSEEMLAQIRKSLPTIVLLGGPKHGSHSTTSQEADSARSPRLRPQGLKCRSWNNPAQVNEVRVGLSAHCFSRASSSSVQPPFISATGCLRRRFPDLVTPPA